MAVAGERLPAPSSREGAGTEARTQAFKGRGGATEKGADAMFRKKARAARRMADEMTDDAHDAIGRAADRAAETYAAARDVAEQIDPFVKDRPYLSVAMGVMAGLVIGGLFLPAGPKVIYVKARE